MWGGEWLEAAVWHASYGYPVFPCHNTCPYGVCNWRNPACAAPGKHSRTLQGEVGATTDTEDDRNWREICPEVDIGVEPAEPTGRLGPKESVGDPMLKAANTLARLVPLERKAFCLDDQIDVRDLSNEQVVRPLNESYAG